VEHVQENVRKEEADKLYTLLEEVRLEHELEN